MFAYEKNHGTFMSALPYVNYCCHIYGPLTGAIAAAGLAILFCVPDYDQYTHGIDSENHAQYMRAKAAQKNA
ncbi:hypothetical protein BGZ80_010259 [Entomortierella chlamydospora]|uniref:Uncharacterized protein n=1 Tax=Entomortierella chlamydospora TaxID=101097 RepID=A0A9P6MW46_9FUNG|nr:hypothetical protein BGZ80_010259 [Entomortierella chlamydospora]